MKNIYIACLILLFYGCAPKNINYELLAVDPPIFPDYSGVTVPLNIAPLNFYVDDFCEKAEARFLIKGTEEFVCYGRNIIDIPLKKWKQLLQKAYQGKEAIQIDIARRFQDKWVKYNPIYINVAEEIDPYIAYRLIEPGYVSWSFMGIYQRNLTNFDESPILENPLTENNCMNCHSFHNYQPDRFTLHMRGNVNGTILAVDGKLKKLDTQTEKTISTFTYPSWHPSGKYIAYSTNKTEQVFHALKEKQIEVLDEASDIVLYDVENNKVITEPLLASAAQLETYPTWSPDGKTLYFCSSDSVPLPFSYQMIQYKIYSIGFDPETRQFGNKIDTVYNPANSSVFPRISPDGRFLLVTRLNYGCFPIWHKEADLCMLDLQTKQEIPGDANSNETESYHSWSSNGKWVMFSSRRQDGLFTRLYFSYVSPDGKMQKPFLLPQRDFDRNKPLLKSYNVPEFISGKVEISPYDISNRARKDSEKVAVD